MREAPASGAADEAPRASPEPKPLVLVISQVYVPDPASVGQHMADAAEELAARGNRVIVLTSARGYEDAAVKYPRRELRGGVEVVRLGFSSFGKASILRRLAGHGLFLLQVVLRGVLARRLAGIVVSTSPPMASFAALAISAVRRAPVTYWLMDLNPDQAVLLGKAAEGSVLVRAMRWLNRQIFARAAQVVVLDRFMAERVRRQYHVGGVMTVLPPWAHDDALEEVPAGANSFLAEHNPDGRFVVMYSGNHSLASPVRTLLHAALRLQDDARFLFMFVGGGLGKPEVDEAIARRRPANIVSLPYQPLERLKFSLSAADLHVVTLGNEMVGVIHPCKVYGAMAVARPVLLIGPRPSHAAELIDRHEVGWQVKHGDIAGLITVLREAAALPSAARTAMGQRARVAIGSHYRKAHLCGAFCDVVEAALRPTRAAVAAAVRVS